MLTWAWWTSACAFTWYALTGAAVTSIVALLPGLAVYRAINLILSDNPAVVGTATIQFVSAVATGLALAGGLSIGGFLARRRFGLDRAAQRARRRAPGHA